MKQIKVLHLGYSDSEGGAARAAARIHNSMLQQKNSIPIDSKSYVVKKHSELSNTFSINQGLVPLRRKAGSMFSRILIGAQSDNSSQAQSLAFPSSGIGSKLNREYQEKSLDLVQLHWIGYGTISIEEIGRLQMPVFWRLADQWAILGAEHYHNEGFGNERKSRYETGYLKQNRPFNQTGLDINRWVWRRKEKSWIDKIGIICPSNWMQECVSKSWLMRDFPTRVIPTPMDLEKWSPGDRSKARLNLGLPSKSKIVLLTAEGGLSKERKGGKLLIEAIKYMKETNTAIYRDFFLVVTGDDLDLQALGMDNEKVVSVGHINDDVKMRDLYRSSDVVVIPSLADNLPGTGLEAQACGIPVVAFRTGGLSDVVEHQKTGLLAKAFNYKDLSYCLCLILSSQDRTMEFGSAARQRANFLWNPQSVVKSYYDFYMENLDNLKRLPRSIS